MRKCCKPPLLLLTILLLLYTVAIETELWLTSSGRGSKSVSIGAGNLEQELHADDSVCLSLMAASICENEGGGADSYGGSLPLCTCLCGSAQARSRSEISGRCSDTPIQGHGSVWEDIRSSQGDGGGAVRRKAAPAADWN